MRRSGVLGERRVRRGADTDQHDVGRHALAVDDHALDASGAGDPLHVHRRAQVDAVLQVQALGRPRPSRRRAPSASGTGSRSRTVTSLPSVAGRRTDLHADPAGSDDHQPLAAAAKLCRRGRRSRRGGAGCALRAARRPRAAASAARPPSPAGRSRSARSESSSRTTSCAAGSRLTRPRRRAQIHALIGIPLGGLEDHGIHALLAREIALRQRRPLVGRVRLLGDDRDVAVVALLAERLRGGTRRRLPRR